MGNTLPATFFTNICMVSAGSGDADREIGAGEGMVIWIWQSRGRVKGGRDKQAEALTRLPVRGLKDGTAVVFLGRMREVGV